MPWWVVHPFPPAPPPPLCQVPFYSKDADRSGAIARWHIETVGSVRLIMFLAIFKPAVLNILRSGAAGMDSMRIPIPSTYPGWRCVTPSALQCLGGSLFHAPSLLSSAAQCTRPSVSHTMVCVE